MVTPEHRALAEKPQETPAVSDGPSHRDAADGEARTEQQASTKRPWVTPELRTLGDLRELVLGGGKRGSNLDSDPTGSPKHGMG